MADLAEPTPAASPLSTASATPGSASASELLGFLKQYEPPKSALASHKDALPAQFKIDFTKKLPQWSAPLATAYFASDSTQPNKAFHALLCPAGLPIRQKAIGALKDLRLPSLMILAGAGLVEITDQKETRFALIYETPNAPPLASIIKERKTLFSERNIAQDFITPLMDVLKRLEDAGIAHGRINLDNLYYSDHLIVGDCLSEPCGFSQNIMFEPIERALSSPMGKGEADSNADCYAAGMVALHLAATSVSLTKLENQEYIDRVLKFGAYNVLMQDREYSNNFQDLLRGTLNEKIAERWGIKTIQSWLGGKRFNLIPPSPPRDASRSFSFLGEDYASRKALAHGLFTHWEKAPEALKDGKLSRWLELSLHKPDLAMALNRASRISSEGEITKNVRQLNEILARSIALLDPDGPIRMANVQVRIEGLGSMLAEMVLQKKQKELGILSDIIENDIPNFIADLNKDDLSSEISTMLWRIQRVRLWMRQSVIGAGIERCLYDLNPTLTCQSPHIAKNCVLDLSALLMNLDAIAKDKASDSEVLDRHSAAFICSRLDLQKELKIYELQNLPMLVSHPKLISLKLLLLAQEKTGIVKLKGLCAWVAYRLMPLFDTIHQRKTRALAQQQLQKAAASGDIRQIAAVMFSEGLFRSDASRFEEATRTYHAYQAKIDELNSETDLAMHAQKNGYMIAQLFAIMSFCAVLAITTNYYLT